MLGGMVGGRTGAMIGGMVGAMVGGRRLGGAIGGLKNQMSGGDDGGQGGPALTEDDAAMLIRVMSNAAKADGEVTQDEVDAILGEVSDASPEEQEYLRQQLASPLVAAPAMAASIPADLAAEGYAVSLAAIRVDTDEESAYLAALADELGLDRATVSAIHEDFGAPQP